jgi:hypothetical protein
MIIYEDVEQGTNAWYSARLGIPTASNFSRIITPAKGELSRQARAYALYLATEILLNMPLQSTNNLEWVQRGRQMEPDAVKQYCRVHEQQVKPVGFITTDDGRIGCSPDRLLVGVNAGLEVKCPSPQVHLGYLIDGPGADYRCQVQGQMYVAELDFVDFYSFHPSMPEKYIRTHRDEDFIRKLAAALDQFNDMKDELLMRARACGYFEAAQEVVTPLDREVEEEEMAL